MKFKDFQGLVLFSSTFKALNLGEKNSSTFNDAWEPWKEIQSMCQKGHNTTITSKGNQRKPRTVNQNVQEQISFESSRQTSTTTPKCSPSFQDSLGRGSSSSWCSCTR